MKKAIYVRKPKEEEVTLSEQREEISKFVEDENLINLDTDKEDLEKQAKLRKEFMEK